MGRSIRSTTYSEEGAYGSVETKKLYISSSRSTDITSFYDENGNHILSYNDTMSDSIIDAINRLHNGEGDIVDMEIVNKLKI